MIFIIIYFIFIRLFSHSRVQIESGESMNINGDVRVPDFSIDILSTLTVVAKGKRDNTISQRQIYIRTKAEVKTL